MKKSLICVLVFDPIRVGFPNLQRPLRVRVLLRLGSHDYRARAENAGQFPLDCLKCPQVPSVDMIFDLAGWRPFKWLRRTRSSS